MKQFVIIGMSCAACQARVEKAVSKVKGVQSCSVNLLTNSMNVEGSANEKDILQAVEQAGYRAEIKQDSSYQISEDKETLLIKKRLLSSICFLIPLMVLGMFIPKSTANGIIQMFLALIVLIINRKFFISGFKGVIHLAPNMDTLVALGSASSFIWSVFSLFSGTFELYFDSSAMILTLITVGKMLESKSKGKTTNALKNLISLIPQNVKIKPGDTFEVKSGESIPADGIILSGHAAINESILTGESLPVDKTEGHSVSAGTINLSGYILCKATKVGEETTLSQIVKLVSESVATKAPIAKLADKVSGIFVPIVISISIITLFAWLMLGKTFDFALARAVSVLVISCPCALGLATPVAVMVGSGIGAKNGILFKSSDALEETGKVQIVVFDKTGTITKGEPDVTQIIPINKMSEEELLQLAYSIELKSEHPLAKAIVKAAKNKNISALEVSDFTTYPGNGIQASINEKTISAGSVSFISEKTSLTEQSKAIISDISMNGQTPILIANSSDLLGIIAVADTLKDDTNQAINSLKQMGIQVVMLTGDNKNTANAIGDLSGIDNVISQVLPQEKDSVIKQLKKYGKVAMVGDGINDAPALTSADVGIAIGAGTDIAIDSANVVLINSKITDVARLINLSRSTLLNIKENLFWAFFYNIIGIPLAAGCFISVLGWQLNPMFGAAAMSLSSFCVVSNALRLNLTNLDSLNKRRNTKRIQNTDFAKVINNINSALENKKMNKTLKIDGMMCCHCEGHVKEALEAIDGVEKAIPSHVDGNAVVTLSKDVPESILVEAVEKQGYKVLNIK